MSKDTDQSKQSLIHEVSGSYVVIDELPKELDYGINPNAPGAKPRLVEKFSEQNETLGFRLEPESWFSWLPLRDYHRKVVFDNCH